MKIFNLLLLGIMSCGYLNAQSIIYVNHSATGQNTGQNWANAYKSLNDAISHAQYGDTLWVAQGTYYPPSATVRDSAILIKNGVKLFGGFSGTETAFAQRNINLYHTILSGDIGVPGDSTDNAYNVMRGTNADSTTVIDGFTVEKGCANIPNGASPLFYRSRGGGLYLRPQMSSLTTAPVVSNCVFRHNYASAGGAAIWTESRSSSNANTRINRCLFDKNFANTNCVVYSVLKGDVFVSNTRFGDNGTANLSLLYSADNVNIQIVNDTFASPLGTHPLVFSDISSRPAHIFIKNVLVFDNIDADFYMWFNFPGSTIEMENCKFLNNKTLHLTCSAASSTLKNNIFEGTSQEMIMVVGAIAAINTLETALFSGNRFENNEFLYMAVNNKSRLWNNFFKNKRLILRRLNAEHPEGSIHWDNCIFYDNILEVGGDYLSVDDNTGSMYFQNCSFIKCRAAEDTLSIFNADNRDSLVFNSCLFQKQVG